MKTITHDTDNPGLFGNMLRSPCKVSTIQTKSAEFGVSSSYTDGVNTLSAKFGICGLTTELEFSLFAVVRALRSRSRTFVA